MAQTKYQKKVNPALQKGVFKINPLSSITVTSQGSISHPVPPKRPAFSRSLKPAPASVSAPGASGTI
jgi:hypothetical protein